jgi:hypothetical protein
MGSSGSSVSQAEIEAQQKAAEEAEKRAIEKAKSDANALSAANAGKGNVGGKGSGDDDGALAKAKKAKGSTLAGQGEATFSSKVDKLGS